MALLIFYLSDEKEKEKCSQESCRLYGTLNCFYFCRTLNISSFSVHKIKNQNTSIPIRAAKICATEFIKTSL